MSHQRIGKVQRNPETLNQDEGVSFEVPYGEDKYGVTLSDKEMDLLFDKKYAETMGRQSLIGSGYVIELESALPLFAYPSSMQIDSRPDQFTKINMGIGIVTQSVVYEHRGILLARRGFGGSWEFEDYEVQPPLRDREEVPGRARLVA